MGKDGERAKQRNSVALMGEIGTRTYVGSAFVTFGKSQAKASGN